MGKQIHGGTRSRSHRSQWHTHILSSSFHFCPLIAFSLLPLPLRPCKYILSLVTTLCRHSQAWVGLKDTKQARERALVRAPGSSTFYPPTTLGALLTFTLCISINQAGVYADQSPRAERTTISVPGPASRHCSCTVFTFPCSLPAHVYM